MPKFLCSLELNGTFYWKFSPWDGAAWVGISIFLVFFFFFCHCITHNYPGTGSRIEWVMWSDAFCFSYLHFFFCFCGSQLLPGLAGFGRWAGCLSCFSGLTTKFENLTQTMSAVGTLDSVWGRGSKLCLRVARWFRFRSRSRSGHI